jgi:hypothetical protein
MLGNGVSSQTRGGIDLNVIRKKYYNTDGIESDANNNSSIVVCVFVAKRTCLSSCCVATGGGMHRHADSRVIS